MVMIEARVLDATHLELAAPINAPCGGKVFLSMSSSTDTDDERANWLSASAESLRAAYDVSEPEYDAAMVKEPNPEYGRHLVSDIAAPAGASL